MSEQRAPLISLHEQEGNEKQLLKLLSHSCGCAYLNAPPTLPLRAASVPTCHVGGLREDVFLCAARSVIFLSEVAVTSRIRQRGGRQQHVDTRAEHVLEVIRDEPANFLSLHKVVLVVPAGK